VCQCVCVCASGLVVCVFFLWLVSFRKMNGLFSSALLHCDLPSPRTRVFFYRDAHGTAGDGCVVGMCLFGRDGRGTPPAPGTSVWVLGLLAVFECRTPVRSARNLRHLRLFCPPSQVHLRSPETNTLLQTLKADGHEMLFVF